VDKKYIPELIKFLGKISCNIEVLKEDGKVEEVFFIKPPKCMFILETT